MLQRAIKPVVFDTPYPTRRRPTLARNVVSTSQPLAAQAGLRMLLAGGNAVDAALAAAITLTVVEPISNGIGSDAFAIIWDGKELHGFNASGRSPAAWTPDYFKGQKGVPVRGWNSVSVPGCVSAWAELSKRFGKLPVAKLFEPAIGYAADGFPVSPFVAERWGPQVPEPRAPRGRDFPFPRPGEDAGEDRCDQGRGVLPRRDRRKNHGARNSERRGDDARRPRRAHERLGRHDQPGLPRAHRARDPAERPGDRVPDGARHPLEFRCRRPSGRFGRQRTPADRSGEARLCRRLPIRRRLQGDAGDAGAAA